ncbi:MAG: hypothetical protein ACYCZB_12310 [Acidiphilium sp.]
MATATLAAGVLMAGILVPVGFTFADAPFAGTATLAAGMGFFDFLPGTGFAGTGLAALDGNALRAAASVPAPARADD